MAKKVLLKNDRMILLNRGFFDEFEKVAFERNGDLGYWEFEVCEKLSLSKKYRYITIDVGMPRSRC
ncbi:UNVERIFIED_ORG: hypothetical protein ABIC97_000640 [Peribacillus simplex]